MNYLLYFLILGAIVYGIYWWQKKNGGSWSISTNAGDVYKKLFDLQPDEKYIHNWGAWVEPEFTLDKVYDQRMFSMNATRKVGKYISIIITDKNRFIIGYSGLKPIAFEQKDGVIFTDTGRKGQQVGMMGGSSTIIEVKNVPDTAVFELAEGATAVPILVLKDGVFEFHISNSAVPVIMDWSKQRNG